MPPLEERVEYPYQNIRVKSFPWGNGDKVSCSLCPLIFWFLLTGFVDYVVSSELSIALLGKCARFMDC